MAKHHVFIPDRYAGRLAGAWLRHFYMANGRACIRQSTASSMRKGFFNGLFCQRRHYSVTRSVRMQPIVGQLPFQLPMRV
jgi:hypothetical protein